MSKCQEVLLNRLQQLKKYVKESRLELLNQDYLEKEIDNIYEATQQALGITDKIKNYILYLENVQIEYYNKYANCLNNTNHNDSKYWDGMHFSALSCIKDLKRITEEEKCLKV